LFITRDPSSGTSNEARHKRYDEQDDEHPEEKPGALHGNARDATEAHRGRDQRNDKKHDCVVQ